MQKYVVGSVRQDRAADGPWLDLEGLVQVELASEDAVHLIEAALLPGGEGGWRAAEPGEQTVRLLFHKPQQLRRVRLRFVESATERTQEFALRWSRAGGRSFEELVRQQFTFSPNGATSEVEDLQVDLPDVTVLELAIIPDQGRGEAYASLAEWRLA
ncbi:MAG TPA: hypothetical protein VFM14_09800 [Gemmatimonadales bacterium]|nr:hypothetical protein [Gemmatimonadales bacterium]